ncbi:MAG: hypothetical protein QM809_11360 [Gordonia sp. (in: high G+C Gram-positive bacteria)]|uniref:hypothetical protein n=1 Tax=Gordonia sp. (in: high G+C Gram-positive bacteria) TaxID=84139 RepID=UPI0039E6AC4F
MIDLLLAATPVVLAVMASLVAVVLIVRAVVAEASTELRRVEAVLAEVEVDLDRTRCALRAAVADVVALEDQLTEAESHRPPRGGEVVRIREGRQVQNAHVLDLLRDASEVQADVEEASRRLKERFA